jgi:hypothetical protein
MATKYIKTKDKKIIIFSGLNAHSDFKNFNPISAGFLHFIIDDNNKIICQCYGESFSLGLKSNEEDSELIQRQMLNLIF